MRRPVEAHSQRAAINTSLSNRIPQMVTAISRLNANLSMLLVVAAIVTSEANGQVERSSRVPATIAMVRDFSESREAFIIRREAGDKPTDIILVRETISAAQLSDAIRTLVTIRHVTGNVPTANATVSMRRTQARKGERKTLPWVGRVLGDLREAALGEVAGVGQARSVTIWLPRQKERS